MKKTLLVLALAVVLVFSFATTASAAYKSYAQGSAYLSWGGANAIYQSLNDTTATQGTSPHGGYTTTTVKCAVCHSTHRAWSASTKAEAGADNNLLAGTNSCGACHATWGANSAGNSLVEFSNIAVAGNITGPHFGGGNCLSRGCHGSVHMSAASKYATVAKFNLAYDGSVPALDAALDAAIASGNVGTANLSTTDVGRSMKAYTTGYVCSACHGASSFSVASKGATNQVAGVINMVNSAAEIPDKTLVSYRTGHPSIGNDTWGIYVPTCETCHDMVGVATGTTAFPHANRGIDVYKGRYDEEFGGVDGTAGAASISTVIPTDNTDATRYGLWMTSGAAINDGSAHGLRASADAQPIVDMPDGAANGTGGYSLQDGACMKCHVPALLP